MVYLFIVLSFILGVIAIAYFRRLDLYEKEPFGKMLAVTVFGGAIAVILALFLYAVQKQIITLDLQSAIGAMFVIGPVEEFGKLAGLGLTFFIYKKELNEPVDGLLYMSCVALGFSLIENIFYALPGPETHALILTRYFISTPAHIFFSAIMGLAFWGQKKGLFGPMALIFAFIMASFMHGLYDLVLFYPVISLLFFPVMYFYYRFMKNLISFSLARSPFYLSLFEWIDNAGSAIESGDTCLNCGDLSERSTFRLGKISVQHCEKCNHYLTHLAGLKHIFRYFGCIMGRLPSRFSIRHSKKAHQYGTLYDHNLIDWKTKRVAFDLVPLDKDLTNIRMNRLGRIDSTWWYRTFFYLPPQAPKRVIQ